MDKNSLQKQTRGPAKEMRRLLLVIDKHYPLCSEFNIDIDSIDNILLTVISSRLRLDKGTETGHMATIHAFLRNTHGDTETPEDTVIYGSSTTNKVCILKTDL